MQNSEYQYYSLRVSNARFFLQISENSEASIIFYSKFGEILNKFVLKREEGGPAQETIRKSGDSN